MTAKEYYTKYKQCFFVDNITLPTTEFTKRLVIDEFIREARSNAIAHKATKDGALLNIVREQDLKWQALCRLFEIKHGFSPLRKYEFAYWAEQISQNF